MSLQKRITDILALETEKKDEIKLLQKELRLISDNRIELEKENLRLNNISISASNKLKCMSIGEFKKYLSAIDSNFKEIHHDYKCQGIEFWGYNLTNKEIIENDDLINIIIINVGNDTINNFFIKGGLNKNIAKRFYKKICKVQIMEYLDSYYKEKFVTKCTSRTYANKE